MSCLPDQIMVSFKNRTFSRFFFAPINTGLIENGEPSPRLTEFHAKRSSSYVGINYVGNVAISPIYKSNDNTTILTSDRTEWTALVQSMQARGSLAGIQLACRYYERPAKRAWRADANGIEAYSSFISGLKEELIDKIMKDFIRSANIAIDLGFDVIQIHAAHGYFLSALISPVINKRQDKYSISNLGGVKDLLYTIRSFSRDALLDVRVSCIYGLMGSLESEWMVTKSIIKDLAQGDLTDIISLSAGLYDYSKRLIYPNKRDGEAPYLPYAIELAEELPKVLVNVAGNCRDLLGLPMFPKNLTYSIGRPLLADPQFIAKSFNNSDDINSCDYSGHCHYYTRGTSHISCAVNQDI